MTVFRAAAVQMRTGIDIEANVAEAERLIRDAVSAGRHVSYFPTAIASSGLFDTGDTVAGFR